MAEQYTPQQPVQPMTAEQRYASLEVERNPFLERGRAAALLTIPALLPPEGANGSHTFHKPWQSVGARGLNNLASKIMLALFPPGSSCFRLAMDDFVLEDLQGKAGEGAGDAKADFEIALAKVERAVMNRMEQMGARLTILEAVKQLLVCGNALIQVLPKGKLVLHKLHSYVCKRDPEGNVLEIVTKQTFSRMTLPEVARQIVEKLANESAEQKDRNAQETVDIYTRISRRTKPGKGAWFSVHQEVCGTIIPGTEGTYPIDKSAWIPLRLNRIDGEDYSRGFVEEFIGDMHTLESLSQSIVTGAAIAAKILFLVKEGGLTSKKKLAETPSGGVVDGDAKDVTILQLDKYADFKIASEVAERIEKRLEQAFLLYSSVQRNAERVTAEEIRYIANELDQEKGGIYSILGAELAFPLVTRIMLQMQKENALPSLPEKTVSPQIVTGLEALGRSADLQKLDIWISGAEQLFGAEEVSDRVDVTGYMKRRGAALNVNTDGLLRSEEDVQKIRSQRQAAELIPKLAPHVLPDANAAVQ